MSRRTDQQVLADIHTTSKYLKEGLFQMDQLIGELCSAQVQEVDSLHDAIEAAHRRWWHRVLGIRWEMTGWSRR